MRFAKNFAVLIRQMREQGEADYKAGKSIDSFYDLPLERHREPLRSAYEIGWRGAEQESKESK